MNILLNILLLGLAVIWFNQRQKSESRKLVLPVVLAFIAGTILVFFISFAIQRDYLDGFLYILCGCLNLLAFWIWTTVSIIYKNRKLKTTSSILPELAQNSLLLIIILMICFLISGASLKIGG